MALDLGDIDEFFDASMTATIGGKRYCFPPVAGLMGLWIKRVSARGVRLAQESNDDAAVTEMVLEAAADLGEPPIPDGWTFNDAMLGKDGVAELLADGHPLELVERLSWTAYARVVGGDKLAQLIVRGDDGPKAEPPNRETRRAAKKAPAAKKAVKKASASRTTNTAAAPTIPSPVSGRTTTSPKKSAAPVKASRGRKS